jgi:transcriptional regulator with XRE-family HTH domain
MTWLGISPDTETENKIDEETLDWQQWVMDIIEEIRKANNASGNLQWEQLANGLIGCSEIVGNSKQLASVVGISKQLLSSWQNRKQMPSFGRMLELCYVLNISPPLLMSNNQEALKEAVQVGKTHRQPRSKHLSPHLVNREQALALIQAVLAGRESPMGVRQLEKRLGLGARTLINHFPQECTLVTKQYQVYRTEQARKRKEQGCNEVRLATLKLYADGINPSANHVASKVSDPGVMRTREGLRAWHAARRELGLES